MRQNINIKIMKKPELTDEEIRSHMQFDKLLEAYKVTGPVSPSGKWFYLGYGMSAVLIISTALYFLLPRSSKTNEDNPQSVQTAQDSSAKSKKQEVILTKRKPETRENLTTSIQPKAIVKKQEQNGTIPTEDKKQALSQFTEAEPINGYSALYEYFDHELKYPVGVARDSIEGIVTVSFAINKEGKPDQIKIENSLGAAFDEECQRVIKSMPIWKPATINGKPIVARLSIPLTFKIKK